MGPHPSHPAKQGYAGERWDEQVQRHHSHPSRVGRYRNERRADKRDPRTVFCAAVGLVRRYPPVHGRPFRDRRAHAPTDPVILQLPDLRNSRNQGT
jgi:hypothetical protein